jgi:hypothetical protein
LVIISTAVDGDEQSVLGIEMVIDRTDQEADIGRDIAHAGGVETAVAETPCGGLQYLLVPVARGRVFAWRLRTCLGDLGKACFH